MKSINIPLFDLAETPSYIIVAGGGGDPTYGKENGIIVMDKKSIESETNDSEVFYKTDDFIKSLNVYVENDVFEDYEEDECSLDINDSSEVLENITDSEKSEEITENIRDDKLKVERDNTKQNNTVEIASCNRRKDLNEKKKEDENQENEQNESLKNEEKETPENEEAEIQEVNNSINETQKEKFWIAAIGESNFYLLEFHLGKFKLLKKLNSKISFANFSKHLFLLYKNSVFGIFNATENPKSLNLKSKKILETELDASHEEYFYNLYKKEDTIVYKREEGLSDIPHDWDLFFIYNKKIHKIVYSNNISKFVFNNKLHTLEGKISNIAVSLGVLIFYITKDKKSHLYFVKDSEKVYELPRITSLIAKNEYTVVVTALGDSIIYKNAVFYNKIHIADLPITGIALDNQNLYFSILNGIVEKVNINPNRVSIQLIIAISVIVIGILAFYFKNK
jgi:hypothetical protein